MAKNYYYLVSGLPDIQFDDSKKTLNLIDFKNELEVNLDDKDYQLIKFHFFQYDNQNLLNILQKKNQFSKQGNFSIEELQEVIKRVKDEGPVIKDSVPYYMQEFINGFINNSFENQSLSPENQLSLLYFNAATNLQNDFVKNYYLNELHVLNFLTASFSRQYDLNYENEILGSDGISEQIRKSNAKDFNLSGEMDSLNSLLQIIETQDIKERERKIDRLRWSYLEDEVFFHYFSIERLFAYVIKMEILDRWTGLSDERGKDQFNTMLEDLNTSYDFPEEYVKK